jgi:hypothetical protein
LKKEKIVMGKIHEKIYLGESLCKKTEHKLYYECLKDVFNCGETEDTEFTKMLKEVLSEELSVDIKGYCSLDTHLDNYHGVDYFITLKTVTNTFIIITFDISLYEKDEWKADFLISPNTLNNFQVFVEKVVDAIQNVGQSDIFCPDKKVGRFFYQNQCGRK